ncbi:MULTISPECIES: hypothetical protein [unclassified Agarivorans]|uniref:hypothetical protein n=1 Tax=unclassified Agarivorans TaxID=2636026 RepID=UPI003D7CD3E9
MQQIHREFDQLLSPLEQLQSLCDRLPDAELRSQLIKQIASIREQNEQAKQELCSLLNRNS